MAHTGVTDARLTDNRSTARYVYTAADTVVTSAVAELARALALLRGLGAFSRIAATRSPYVTDMVRGALVLFEAVTAKVKLRVTHATQGAQVFVVALSYGARAFDT